MKTRSPKTTYSGRMVVLATLVMATVLVLSAPMADARKKHHHVVQCPTGGSSFSCNGTAGNDHLIGRAGTRDLIFGKEGNDVYEGNGGPGDELIDVSTTSSDTYVFKGPDLGNNFVEDCGGAMDIVNLSSTSFRLLDNVAISRQDNFTNTCNGTTVDDLILTGPGGTVEIVDFGSGSIEQIKFANGTLTF